MGMIDWLKHWLETDDTKLMYILGMILIANMLDFMMGWVNAKFNKNVSFSSSKAIFGIARKIGMFILLIYFIPVALLVPEPIGISTLYILYLGYLASELQSVFNHLKLAEDDKQVNMFIDFISKLFVKKEK